MAQHKCSKAEGAGWMEIASGRAFAVMAGVFAAIACASSDAHLNRAVTMGFGVSTGHFAKFAPYLIAPMAGAFAGAVLVNTFNFKFSQSTNDDQFSVRLDHKFANDNLFARVTITRMLWKPMLGRQNSTAPATEKFYSGGESARLAQDIIQKTCHRPLHLWNGGGYGKRFL